MNNEYLLKKKIRNCFLKERRFDILENNKVKIYLVQLYLRILTVHNVLYEIKDR
jgi:hypothetical protein